MALSSLFTGPLFSTIVTLFILVLLYFPSLFLWIIFSPILISTSILLLSLLRLGAIQKKNRICDPIPAESDDIVVVGDDCKRDSSKPNDSPVSWPGCCDDRDQGRYCSNAPFVGWDVRAPLDVIHEGYEGQGEEGDDVSEARITTIERYGSLSKYYPETDSDSSEDEDFLTTRGWDPSENIGFRWAGEDRDGMIEIELEGQVFSDVEEDNLIEIDLHPASSPAR